jgi:uncharacterized protein (DUF952 family)
MAVILHITTHDAWQQALEAGAYRGDTLDAEGFIHCSTPEQVTRVANALFRGQTGLALLCIDPDRLASDLKYEQPDAVVMERFPHLYGPLNLDAVIRVVDFPPGADGTFALPDGVGEMG